MSAYANLPKSNLEIHLNALMLKYTELNLATGDNSEALSKLSLEMEEVGEAIETKTKTEIRDPHAEVATLNTTEAKFNYNSMVNHIKSNVPTLQPPLDVSVFIQRLDNCYNLFVKPYKYLEPYFIQQAKSQLSSDILENLNASNDETDDFDKLKLYLKKNYGSKETPFQIMGELLESMPKEGERLQEWSARQERRSDIVATQIISKFNEHQKKSNKPEMTVKDSFNLFCSMVTYEYVRKHKPDCFKLMVKEVDTCWRPTEVGSLAATLVDRMDIPDLAANQSFSARPHQKQQRSHQRPYKHTQTQGETSQSTTLNQKDGSEASVCLRHLVYQSCPFGERCKRKHVYPGDDEHDKILQKLNNSSSETSQADESQANVALPQMPYMEKSREELQPEEIGIDFFDTSFLYSHNTKN